MSAVGAEDTAAPNTSTFVAALISGLVVGFVYLTLFYVLHSRDKKVFQPKTYLGPPQKRVRELPANPIGWFKGIWTEPDSRVAEGNGLDAYFFVRFCKVMMIVLLPSWVLTWVILMPVSATKPNLGQVGLNIFTIGNVGNENRLIAHMLVAVVIIFWTLFVLYREFMHWAGTRLAYLASSAYAQDPRSRSVMLTNIPASANASEDALRQFIGTPAPETVWLVRKLKPIEKLVEERDKEVARIEKGVTAVQTLASKNVRKNKLPPNSLENDDPVGRYVLEKKRPSHRTGFLGLFGKKLDTLDDTPLVVREKNDDIDRERRHLDTFPLSNSAFARFPTQADAHAFALAVSAHSIKSIPRTVRVYIDVIPEDVIWPNLSMSPAMRLIRLFISWACTIGLIIIWLPLVALVGVISNIVEICKNVSWLAWICKLPSAVRGIIQGILPPVALAILFMLLPIFLRTLIKLQGEPRHSTVERKLWNRFWLFQIIHGFLIVALASGLIGALKNIKSEAAQFPQKLAENLPKSSIFFLTFILTTTLGGATKTFSRAVPFIMGKLAFILRSNIPRKAYKYDWSMSSISLATTWPPVALLGVIATVYTVVQPIIVGFACCGFVLLYLTYKYMLIWVCEQPTYLETNGFYYPYALGAIFAGLYVEEIFLTALLILRKTTVGYACGGIIAATIPITIVFQFWVDRRSRAIATYLGSEHGKAWSDSKERLSVNPPPLRPLEVQDDAGTNAFNHPVSWKPQPPAWIAHDNLGIGELMRERIANTGVDVSTEGATMGEDGKTAVTRGPPGELWFDDTLPKDQPENHKAADEGSTTASGWTHAHAPTANSSRE
ncbi:DUF221-domain-containing protein [Auriculariales sp. MPI-PUGE-AT-0066]|nr:DUF221-domain-containing protein [Auriculariales sp. MPI-PUGE-AT-0066]